MKRICAMFILGFLFLLGGWQAQAQQDQTISAAGTTCATTGACVVVSVPANAATVSFTVSANASGNTLQFEETQDGKTFIAVNAFPPNSTTSATSTTGTGTWRASVAGMVQFRIRCSTLAGGTSTVSINISNAVAASTLIGGGGGGGNAAAYCPDTSVVANTITCTTTPAQGALTTGLSVNVLIANTVTGATTIAVSGLTAKAVTKNGTTPLVANDLLVGGTYLLTYDGTEFVAYLPNGGPIVVSTPPTSCINGTEFKVNGVTIQCGASNTYAVVGGGPIYPGGLFTSEILFRPGESAAAAVDYSGHGNGTTAATGTAPTISASGAGLVCGGAGQVKIAAGANSVAAASFWLTFFKANNNVQANIYVLFGGDGAFQTNGGDIYFSSLGGGTTNELDAPSGSANNFVDTLPFAFEGTHLLTVVFGVTPPLGGLNTYYIDGIQYIPRPAGTHPWVNATTNYDLCGQGQGVGGLTQLTANIGGFFGWTSAPTQNQVAALAQAMNTFMTANGAPAVSGGNKSPTVNELTVGLDSESSGGGPANYAWVTSAVLDDTYTIDTAATQATQAVNYTYPTCLLLPPMYTHPQAQKNALIFDIGINDVTTGGLLGPAAWAKVQGVAQCMALPYDAMLISELMDTNVTNGEARMNTFNPLVDQNFRSIKGTNTRLVALGATILGVNGNAPNTALFTDGLHPTKAQMINTQAVIESENVNAAYGHKSLTEATTYTAGTSVGTNSCVPTMTETANTVTGTCAAETFAVGQLVTVVGMTPNTYNGTFMVITANATTFTYFDFTSGIGNSTISGTATVPLMHGRDVYAILGGTTAGNTDMENWCAISVNQPVYRYVTNPNGWSIVGFPDPMQTPLINNLATLFAPYGSTVTLTGQEGAAGTGTCNWSASISQPPSNVIVFTADWTCGTTGTVASCTAATIVGSTVTPMTFTLPLQANSVDLDCDLVVSSATGTPANNWNLLTATNGATNTTASYAMGTAAAVGGFGATTDQGSTTTTFSIGGTWTLGAAGTKFPAHIHARIEGASASGTVLSLQVVDPTVADLLTIYRGSTCRIR